MFRYANRNLINRLDQVGKYRIADLVANLIFKRAAEISKNFRRKIYQKLVNPTEDEIDRFITELLKFVEVNVPDDLTDKQKELAKRWLMNSSVSENSIDFNYSYLKPIEVFFKAQRYLPEDKRDLLTLSPKDLIALEDIGNQALLNRRVRSRSNEFKEKAAQTTQVILDNDEWLVSLPHSKEAAIELGKGTTWCTATTSNNYFDNYYEPNDPLIVFQNKTNGEKYQLHLSSKQFMDKNDSQVSEELEYALGSLLNNNAQLESILVKEIKTTPYNPNGKNISITGEITTLKDGRLHSYNDEPAIIYFNGTQYWFLNGRRHREGDKPAVIEANGDQTWFLNDRRHRDGDKPAVIYADGTQEWWLNGERHRDGGKPAVIDANGTQAWYLDGKLHRDGDKPAIIRADGTQSWWLNDQRHRDGDKPAVIYSSGTQEFWQNGISIER